MDEEEQEWFPKVRKGLSRATLQDIGARMVEARETAPRSPVQPSALKKAVDAVIAWGRRRGCPNSSCGDLAGSATGSGPGCGKESPVGSTLSCCGAWTTFAAGAPAKVTLSCWSHSASGPGRGGGGWGVRRSWWAHPHRPRHGPRARTWPRILGQWLTRASHEPLWEVPQYRRTGAATHGVRHGCDALVPDRGRPHACCHTRHAHSGCPGQIAPQDWSARLSLAAASK